MDYSFNDLKHVIDNQYNTFSNFNKSCVEYLQNISESDLKKYNDIVNKKGAKLGNFNLFDLISKKWHHENFHSDILKFLLENYSDFFDNFLTLIGVADKEHYKNYEVTRKEDNIDVLIKSDTHAIIIENKINWAGDQESQIYRYYKKVKATPDIEVEKIVYLTPSEIKKVSENSLGHDVDEKEVDRLY